MTKKQVKTDENISPDVQIVIDRKITFFQDVIQKTILYVQKNKMLDILTAAEVNSCLNSLGEVSVKLKDLVEKKTWMEDSLVSQLQVINNDLSSIFKLYGTESLEDLLSICFGNQSNFPFENPYNEKFILLKKYFHPTGYKVVPYKEEATATTNNYIKASPLTIVLEDVNAENVAKLECYDIAPSTKKFHMKVYGLKFYLYNSALKKTILLLGAVDDIIVDFLCNNSFINMKTQQLADHTFSLKGEGENEAFHKFTMTLSLKDYLIYKPNDIVHKFMGILSQISTIKQKTINHCVKEFIQGDLFTKRNTLVVLLSKPDDYENQYLSYLLYDLLSNDANDRIDTHEQTLLFDSFPWTIKSFFKDAMKKTIQYTNELSHFDANKIPLEQQICLMKAHESVKEKAMIKLKEVKSKTEDSGAKARQYLEGLLKIPFQIYRREPIMNVMEETRVGFDQLLTKYQIPNPLFPFVVKKDKYTSVEIAKYIAEIKRSIYNKWTPDLINAFLKKKSKESLEKIARQTSSSSNTTTMTKKIAIIALLEEKMQENPEYIALLEDKQVTQLLSDIAVLERKFKSVHEYMNDVKKTLDHSAYGHDKAKKQIERIVGQWMNGQQDGYCFGFEGPPGVGKTTLAKKGLSDCLKDGDGNPRPFAMIQMGGDSNANTLHGHNYTYVGSTWGSIVQILMDKKCMNPIIFIDEVDKISKTEQGRDIVGILIHLLDSTQNDCFQDKYFSGIDIDLSKALFILSYNDASSIDRILLDRIHRVKFSNLSLDDKLVIARNHILPEVFVKMGMQDMVYFSNEVLRFIIDEYTMEAGVRKLKEALFEIVGEINLDILKQADLAAQKFPMEVTKSDIQTKYFKERREVRVKRIHPQSVVGVINCLWANDYGNGGILSAHGKIVPADKFLDLKMTGLLDDMMRESFQISLTLAYDLTPESQKQVLRERFKERPFGIHLHMGDGSVNKSGTSAGIAISLLMYSLLNGKKIRNDFAVTGEAADLNGSSGEIGALKIKFISGIKAGVKNFIYPRENERDYLEFMEKHGDTDLVKGIRFYAIDHIQEAIDLIVMDDDNDDSVNL